MPKKEINNLLDDYITKKRKKQSYFSFSLKKEKPIKEIKDAEITIIEAEEPFFRKIIKFVFNRPDNTKVEEIEEQMEDKQLETDLEDLDQIEAEEINSEQVDESDEVVRKSIFQRIKEMFSKSRPADYEANYEYEEENLSKSIIQEINEIEEAEQNLIQQNQQLIEKRKSLLQVFLEKFSEQEDDVVPASSYARLEEDLKEIAKITTNILKMLPSRKLAEFKNSNEMDKFKSILKKHKIIK
jgi:hypothetical protein